MPEHRGRPKIHTGRITEVVIRFGEDNYSDLSQFATECGLSVPAYCALMLHMHINGVKRDGQRLKLEVANA